MKNLLIYINPDGGFNEESEILTKIQIDNSLELGWDEKDIILLTNFDYEYRGVKSTVVDDTYFNVEHPTSTKFRSIRNMFLDDLIKDELYWSHDLDCFQVEPISEQEILEEMDGKDVGICDYGASIRYSGGSVFFKKSAENVFIAINRVMEKHHSMEEKAMTSLVTNNLSWIKGKIGKPANRFIPVNFGRSEYVKSRVKVINFTYNFWDNNLKRRMLEVKKPIRTVHFDLFYKLGEEGSRLDVFSGKNNLNIDFVGKRLRNIFLKNMGTIEPQIIKDLRTIEWKRQRRIWRPFMKKHNIDIICEVGVSISANFKRYLYGNPKVLVGVDLWKDDGIPGHNDSLFTQKKLDEYFEYARNYMLRFPSIRIYRMLSHEAVENFPDGYFDLVYIDGDHSYEGCKQDLEDWWPKVKKGGLFLGDDYSHQHARMTGMRFEVIKAVDEFVKNNDLTLYIVPMNNWAIIK